MIELYGNKIAKLERGSWVSDLPNLLYLQIQNNEIAQVEPGALNLPKLQYLDLSGNKIAKLEPARFMCLILLLHSLRRWGDWECVVSWR